MGGLPRRCHRWRRCRRDVGVNDFGEIQALAGALIRQLGASERRALLRRMARGIQKSQSDRIGRQKDPDGAPFAARRERRAQKPGNYAVKFLYPKGDANPRAVFMKSWVHDGPMMTGFDIEAGGIRSFFYDKVAQYLPVDASEQNAGAGKLRRQGTIRQKAEIARVHHEGLRDKPALKGRAVRYAARGLLGMTQTEQSRAIDMLLDHIGH
jgi:hypothetical protein